MEILSSQTSKVRLMRESSVRYIILKKSNPDHEQGIFELFEEEGGGLTPAFALCPRDEEGFDLLVHLQPCVWFTHWSVHVCEASHYVQTKYI